MVTEDSERLFEDVQAQSSRLARDADEVVYGPSVKLSDLTTMGDAVALLNS